MNIGHYMLGIWDPGGIAAYIRRVGLAQREAGHSVCFLDSRDAYADFPDPALRPIVVAENALPSTSRALGLDVVHCHAPSGSVTDIGPPQIRTVHEHRPYCPSGERYLNVSRIPCDRRFGLVTCTLGHIFERCGSIQPMGLVRDFMALGREHDSLANRPVIAISNYVRDQMVRVGYDADLIEVLLNPAPKLRRFSPPPCDEVPRFLFAGRIAVHKGLDWLIRSLATAPRPIALDVAGEGPRRAAMEELAACLGVGERVKFHGWVDECRIDELAAKARAIVFPSVWHEPAGLTTFEGSSRGRAVIASRTGGIPEYAIEGRNALLVEPNDELALAASLTRLVDDWDLACRLGIEGYAMASGPYSLDRHVAELDRIYTSLSLTRRSKCVGRYVDNIAHRPGC